MSRPKIQNYKGHGLSKGKEREQRASIRFKTTLMNTLMDVLRHRPGWVEVKDEGEWDFYWCDVSWLRENFDHTYMDEHVRISHFRNHYERYRPPCPSCYPADPQELHGEEPEAFPETAGA
uniref:Tubulin tyrosine ligase like 9 n=1 Tax=Rousettus aegyptiacus TaxID=9407 RepID=A0A7J8DM06_ROUAE|nr:tubulin tyrosine ligase like 9 [Rousettus aegyptiacus]